MSPRTVRVRAPAKVNLALHVTGQRADGYHELDTLVAFGPAFDTLTIAPADRLHLTITGPEGAGLPADDTNLVLKVANMLAESRGAAITLDKHLPLASGIGGGSADAAATFRGLVAHWGKGEPGDAPDERHRALVEKLLSLGADIPMCLTSSPQRAGGIGEILAPAHGIPPVAAILANPRVPVSTPQVFDRLTSKDNAPLTEPLPDWPTLAAFTHWLATTRNDLEGPAISLHPEIARTRDTLANCDGARFARMSGSGATSFAIFDNLDTAEAATRKLARDHPDWWIAGGLLGDMQQAAQPHFL